MTSDPHSEPSPAPPRPLRADARRNYERLLAAAKDLFAEQGVDAPLDEVARRAGLGNATLYRHFPTRGDLIVAVCADEVVTLCAHGTHLRETLPAADALFEWLRAFVAHVATKRHLAVAIADNRAIRRSALFDDWHESMRRTSGALLERAQQAGAVRHTITIDDLHTLANGIALAASEPEQMERLIGLVRHGTETRTA